MKSFSKWKVSLCIIMVSVAGTVFTLYNLNTKPKRFTPTGVRFDTSHGKLYALRKISGITFRNVNNIWTSADDVCYNGVVFPSHKITSTLVNVTVYFHNETEMRETINELRKKGSWERKNLNLLLESMNRLTNASFIDIHAGIGLYSLPVARLGRGVIAVEYRYTFAERLCRGIIAGQFKGKAIIVNNMVSHVSRTADLQPQHSGQRSLRESNMTDDVFTKVSSIELVSLLQGFTIKEAVLRIDMAEDVVKTVMSSSHFFDQVQIHYILMKWSNSATSNDTKSLIDFLAKYELIPCINPKCRNLLKIEHSVLWPSYVWWVNKAHMPRMLSPANNVRSLEV